MGAGEQVQHTAVMLVMMMVRVLHDSCVQLHMLRICTPWCRAMLCSEELEQYLTMCTPVLWGQVRPGRKQQQLQLQR